MNFDFDDAQKALRDQARRFFAEQGGYTPAREVLEGGGSDPGVWQQIADLGWLGAAVPKEYGGVGLSMLEVCIIAEEAGRVVTPQPILSNLLAIEAIKLAGDDDQKATWLPQLADGSVIGTLGFAEPGQSALSVPQTARGDSLTGVKQPVSDGLAADVAIVSAMDDGWSLYLVDLRQDGVTREALTAIDLVRPQAALTFDAVKAQRLGPPGLGRDLIERLHDIAAVLVAFEQLGGADAAMEMALDYAKQRYAFGRPIGGNQAVKHKLADMFVANQMARSHAYYGAWALSTDAPELALAAAGARLAATSAYTAAAEESVEIHGGIGFTWESDCQFHYRRARLLALMLGSTSRWESRLVDQLRGRNQ